MADKFDVIQLLFDSYNGEWTDGNIKAYIANLGEFSDRTVAMAVRNFTTGKIDRNGSFRPSSEELFKECDRIVNGVAADLDTPLAKFLAASARNKEQVKREDLKLEHDRGPNKRLMANPEYREAGRIFSSKKMSLDERAKAMDEMIKMKTGSEFEG